MFRFAKASSKGRFSTFRRTTQTTTKYNFNGGKTLFGVGVVSGAGLWFFSSNNSSKFYADTVHEVKQVEEVKIKEIESTPTTKKKKENSITSIFQLIWKAIKESPFLTLSTIISGILNALVPLLLPAATRKFLDITKDENVNLDALIRPTIEIIAISISSAIISTLDYCLLTELVSRIQYKISTHLFSSFMRQDMVGVI